MSEVRMRTLAAENAAPGLYDLRFTIYDSGGGPTVVAGPRTNSPVGVTNGLFTVTLDFGGGVFTGSARWLEIAVKSNGVAGPRTALSPRQPLTAAPYGITSGNLNGTLAASQLTGTLPSALMSGTYSQPLHVTGSNTFVGNGAGLGGLSACALSGNRGTTPGTHFLGTTDDLPLELRANSQPALRLTASGNVIVDPAGRNTNGILTPGLAFGGVSGEGISSQRGSGAGQRGLDFYTASQARMTIANGGNGAWARPIPARRWT